LKELEFVAKEKLEIVMARQSRDLGISRGAFLAARGGENRPNYFKNRPPMICTPKSGHRNCFLLLKLL